MLIDKLLFIFEADAKDANAEVKKTRQGADDVTDAMKAADDQSKVTLKNIAQLAKGAIGFFATAAAAGKTLGAAISLADEIYVLDEISKRARIAIEDVDGFSRSVVAMGGDLSTAQSNVAGLADAFIHMENPMEGILSLADEIAGLDYQQASLMLEGFGIADKATIELMRQGRDELGRLMGAEKENSLVTAEMTERALAFRQTMTAFRTQVSDTSRGFITALLPAITWVIDSLTKATRWLSENKNVAIGFFIGVSAAILAFFLPAMLSAAAATIAATWPFIAIGAAIGAAAAMFALIYDDIMAFISGNDSLIGQILEKYPMVGRIFQFVGNVIRESIDMAVAAFEWLTGGIGNIIDRVKSIDSITDAFRAMGEGVVAVFKWMWGIVGAYFDLIGSGIDKVKGAIGWVAGKLGFGGGDDVSGDVEVAQDVIASAAVNPANSISSNTIRNSTASNVEQNLAIGEITITTQATDAQGVARETRSELQEQLERMQAENSGAIAR